MRCRSVVLCEIWDFWRLSAEVVESKVEGGAELVDDTKPKIIFAVR
jgi:hypothetical protein